MLEWAKDTELRPEQIRAARAALRWTQEDLAERAGVHAKSVAYWEARDGSGSTVGAVPQIRRALLAAGVAMDGDKLVI